LGFVRTAAEVERIEALLGAPAFRGGEQLTVEFRTEPAVIEQLLPPPLEPVSEPLGVIGIGRWRGNAIGEYAGGSIYLAARYGELQGGYALAMWMDSEPALQYGRELFGEPKKLARARLDRDGDGCVATVERHGAVIIRLRAEGLGADLGASAEERVAFNYRSRTGAGGAGLDGPAALTATSFAATLRGERVGRGAIELRGTPHDPLEEIPIVSVGRARLVEHDIEARCEAVANVAAEDFLPYHHGRGSDDWLQLGESR
jgi:acetoacetate decarboxylase